jgi:hypothetical protein
VNACASDTMITRTTVFASHGALGLDTDTRLSLEQYTELCALGFQFVTRYLGDLTTEEVDDILTSGLLLNAVQHAHTPGTGLAGRGADDGRRAVSDAAKAGLPPTELWADIEEPSPSTTVSVLTQYSAEWCAAVVVAAHTAGVYWGASNPGSAQDVYHLAFTGYWKSFSNVVTPFRRGYKMVQLYHYPKGECVVRDVFQNGSPLVANVAIDVDVAQSDYLGGRPRMVAAAG